MVFEDDSERPKAKPRGRPFPKGNIKGKDRSMHMASARHERSVSGATIALGIQNEIEEPVKEKIGVAAELPPLAPQVSAEDPIKKVLAKDEKNVQFIDSLDFRDDNGNTLRIVLSNNQNRSYRLQIFLNDKREIRPITYNGRTSACEFWELLKESLKRKDA